VNTVNFFCTFPLVDLQRQRKQLKMQEGIRSENEYSCELRRWYKRRTTQCSDFQCPWHEFRI